MAPKATKKPEEFLSIRSPTSLAKFLLDQPYRRFRRLIYPSPRYKTFVLPKRSGGFRTIDAPAALLKSVQRSLATVLLDIYGAGKPSVHSFVRGRSIVSNAAHHTEVRKNFILNVDLEDFFGTVHFGRVRGMFSKPPFSFPMSVASILAHICCYKGRLPQGAPTSPIVANFIVRALDSDLQNLARVNRSTYTRYCDDITFSFSVRAQRSLPPMLVNLGSTNKIGEGLEKIISDHSFQVNEKKVRLRARSQRLEVTGLTANEFPNVSRQFVDEIRGALHAWKVHGLEKAQAAFLPRYKKILRRGVAPSLERVLWGRLLYLRMVRGREDKIYTRLAERYNELMSLAELPARLPLVSRVRTEGELRRAVFVLEATTSTGDVMREGTAFLLENVGFITCEHVVRKNDASAEKDLRYFDSEEGDSITISNPTLGYFDKKVKVLFKDVNFDVAVLSLPPDLPPLVRPLHLRAGDPGGGERVYLAGFPNYSRGKTMMMLESRVLGLYPKMGIQHFEIESLIRAGNSGGPVLDSDFYVVGLAKEGARQEGGNNAALSSSELRRVVSGRAK
jgi:RNA-directed DNA polymerase